MKVIMRRVRVGQFGLALTTLALTALTGTVSAQTFAGFTPGNVVVSRVGDGTTTLNGNAASVFLDQYTAGGTLVTNGTIALPTTVNNTSAGNRALTDSGSAGSDGFLKLSTDGQYLTLGGYNVAPGTTGVVATTPTATTNQRVIGRVDFAGNVDTTTALSDAYGANNFRSVITTDGNAFFTGGAGTATTGGIRYANPDGATTSTQLENTQTNTRVVNIFNGQLYATSGSGVNVGINKVGTGLPTTSGQTFSLLPVSGTPTGTGTASPYDTFFSSNSTTGVTTVYLTDDRAVASGGGLQKYTFDGTTLTYQYTLNQFTNGGTMGNLPAGLRGLAGVTDANGVTTLYATTGEAAAAGNRLVSITDTGSTALFTQVVGPTANIFFRGVAFSPQMAITPTPEPGGVASLLIGFGALGVLVARRRRAGLNQTLT